MIVTADNVCKAYADGQFIGEHSAWNSARSYTVPDTTKMVTVYGHNLVSIAIILVVRRRGRMKGRRRGIR